MSGERGWMDGERARESDGRKRPVKARQARKQRASAQTARSEPLNILGSLANGAFESVAFETVVLTSPFVPRQRDTLTRIRAYLFGSWSKLSVCKRQWSLYSWASFLSGMSMALSWQLAAAGSQMNSHHFLSSLSTSPRLSLVHRSNTSL